MSFESTNALTHLLRNGSVVTFRKSRRKRTGKDWINSKRNHPKIADVRVRLIGRVERDFVRTPGLSVHLREFVDESGFPSLDAWKEEIRRLNGGEDVLVGYLYRVSLSKEEE